MEQYFDYLKRLIITGVTIFAAVCWLGMTPLALAFDDNAVTPPPTPAPIQVPAGNTAFLVGHATGTQGYICLPSASTPPVSWTVNSSRPEANLLDSSLAPVVFHFLSPNPYEVGKPRATWQNAQDTSSVWGNKVNSINAGTDPSCPSKGAIPCLPLQVVGSQADPNNGDDTELSTTTYIQRLNTTGGSAPSTPSTGCALSTDVGGQLLVPYTADYYFFHVQGSGDQRTERHHSSSGRR